MQEKAGDHVKSAVKYKPRAEEPREKDEWKKGYGGVRALLS